MSDFAVITTVSLMTDKLTTEELCIVYRAAVSGFDPSSLTIYQKARDLFTENNGTEMHSTTLEALELIINERLNSEKQAN